MKRLLLLLLSSLSFITTNSYAQIFTLTGNSSKTATTCKGTFASAGYDVSGTAQWNYYRSYENNGVYTFKSGGGPIRVNFTYANFLGSDKLEIWDGTTTSAPSKKIGTLINNNENRVFTSTSGNLTFRFTGSNNPVDNTFPNAYGWQGLIGCMPVGCDGNFPASDVAGAAPVICNLDGYCGSTSGWYTARDTMINPDEPNNFGTIEGTLNSCSGNGMTIQNNSWLAFYASANSANITIKTKNCSNNNKGIQAAVLSSNASFTSFTLKSQCVYDGENFTLNATGLSVGTKYYIMIDGGFGNDCEYTVTASSGIQTITASSSASTICEGQPVTLTASTGGSSYQWSDGVTSIPAGREVTVYPTTTRTYTCTVIGACDAPQKPTAKVTVKPKPVVTPNPTSQTFCSGGTTSIALNSSVTPVTYVWNSSKTSGGTVTGFSNGTASTISQTLNATGTTAGVVTYTITPTANACVGDAVTVPVTVNPIPVLTVNPTSQIFCSGGTTNIALTSNVAGTTYGWTTTTVTNVSGSSTPGTGTPIAQTLSATATTAGTVVYEVTPTAAGCAGTKKTATITVNPRPTITPTTTAPTICSGSSTSIGLTSDISGATYSWTIAVTGGVTGASAGSGSNIIQTLNTNGTTVGTVEYTITATTPAPASCTNSAVTKVLVTVNPIPTISIDASSATICNGGSTTLTATVAPAGGTFLWTPGNATTNPIVVSPTSSTSYNCQYTVNGCSNSTSRNITVNQLPANVAITPNPGSASICNGKSITLTASSSDAGGSYLWAPGGATTPAITVSPGANTTYTVTYTLPTTCAQTATQAVTVKTVPTVTVTPTQGTICNGASTTLNTNVSSGGGTYVWSPGGSTATSITVSPTSTTTYSLTYTATNACASAVNTTTVTVNPKDNANFNYSSATYCSSGADPSAINIVTPGSFSATPAGMVFLNATLGTIDVSASTQTTYSVKYTTTGTCPNTSSVNLTVTGALKAGFNFSTGTYCQYGLVNPVPIYVVGGSAGNYSSTPAGLVFVSTNTGEVDLMASTPGVYQVRNIIPASGAGCAADTSAWVPITITAAPVLNATSFTPSVCSPAGPNVTLSGGNTYTWTVDSPLKITGAAPGNGILINQTLTTTDSVPGIVHYIVTPTGATGCTGKVDTVDVTVNPVPDVNATPVTPSVCSGLVTDIKLSSNIPAATFSWPLPILTNAIGGVGGSGNVIAQTLTATTANPGTVVYRITPNAFTCNGAYIDVTVNVNPNPVTTITIPPADQTICSGETTNIHLTSSTGSTSFEWTVNQSGITGATNGTGTDINQLLTVIGSTSGKAIYTIKGIANGCSGAMAIDSVTVNPIPVLQVTPLKQEICSGTATNIALVSNLSGTTFSWKVGSATITGGSDGSTGIGNIIQTLTNPGSVVDSITYKIIATAGGCSSALDPLVDSVVATITVNPKPMASTVTPVTICSGDSTKIAITSNVAGSTFTYKALTTGVTGAGDGAGDSIKQTLSVITTVDSVIYNITPTSLQGCIGNPFSAKVIVNATPEITFTPSSFQSVCSGTAVLANLISNVPGTTINWTPRVSAVTGTKSGSGLSPAKITDTLSVTSDTAATVIYDVTAVSAKGCVNAPLAALLKFTVNPLPQVIPVIKSTTICDGDSLIVPLSSNVAGTNYTWDITQTNVTGAFADTNVVEIRQKLKLIGTTPGTVVYSITSNSPQGCHNTNPELLTITVNPLDNAAFNYSSVKYCQSEIDPTAIKGSGSSGTFTSVPAGVIFTNNSTGTIDLSATPPGFYNINYTTNGACQQNSFVALNIYANPTADTSAIVVTASSCGTQTGSVTGITNVNGTMPMKYEWKNSSGVVIGDSLLLDSITPGIYKLTITDANGCSLSIGNGNNLDIKNLQTVKAAFVSDVTEGEAPLTVQFTNQSTSVGPIFYNWNFDNGTTSTLKDPTVTFNEIGNYTVCLIVTDDKNACRDTACMPNPIEVTTISDISIIPNVFTPNGDGVNDILKITAEGLSTVNAQIYNRWGQKEFEWSTLNGGWDGYSASGLPATPGTYYIVLIAVGADKNKTEFMIKKSFTLIR
jgi:gliding motility-associated-like protein